MFAELCRTGRTHELVTTHRFTQRWEQAATLALRDAHPDALAAYLDHDRISAGGIEDHPDTVAHAWTTHHSAGRTVAVTAETNAQVDLLNDAIQTHRRHTGDLDPRRAVPIAGDETAGPGDLIVTRRNRHGAPRGRRTGCWSTVGVDDRESSDDGRRAGADGSRGGLCRGRYR